MRQAPPRGPPGRAAAGRAGREEIDPTAADTRRAVREAVGRLPADYRAAVELCYVAGYTTAEAADRLGWPKGTVLTRLAWARQRLRADLLHRGIAPATGAVGGLLLDRAACAVGPAAVQAASRAAATVAMQGTLAGLASERAVHLTEGVLRAMTATKLSWAAGLAALAVTLTGVGVTTWAAAQTKKPVVTSSTKKAAPAPATPRPPETVTLPPADAAPVLPDLTPNPGVAIPSLPQPTRAPEPEMLPPTQPAPSGMIPPAEQRPRTYTLAHPSGTWTREFAEGTKLAVRFDDDRLVVEATFTNVPPPPGSVPPAAGSGSRTGTLLIDADYAMNKEGVVFGVITGIEHDLPANTLAGIERFVGQPFAFRLRQDDQAMTAKELKLGGMIPGQTDAATQTLTALLIGRYYPAGKDVAGPGVRKQLAKPRLAIGSHDAMMPSLTVPRTSDESVPAILPSAGPNIQELPASDRVPSSSSPGASPNVPPQPIPSRPAPKKKGAGSPATPSDTVPNY
ncbi:MAG: sigma factor-like helix-turn-helix DNA-binding protein [Gemmataceae bacterium]